MTKTYTNLMPYAAFPLGGIGTGTISLHASGYLQDFEIFNRPSRGVKVPYSFFAMHAEVNGKTDTRVLEASRANDFYQAQGYHPMHVAGLPHFASSRMTVQYPFAEISFQGGELPLNVTLRAFNPCIPLRADDSGIPAISFEYEVENTSDAPATVTIASSMSSIHNFRGYDNCDNWIPSPKCHNERRAEGAIQGVFLSGDAVPEDDLAYANCAILSPEANAQVRPLWYQGGWYDGITDFWNLLKEGRVTASEESAKMSRVGPEPYRTGSVGVTKEIPAHGTATFTFALSWYVPNRIRGWSKDDMPGQTIKNRYAALYPDAWSAGVDLLTRLSSLREATRRFSDALHSGTLPDSVTDALASNISALRSNTCFRTYDGSFFAWEGCHDQEGSCHGTCTHVWNYAQTVAFLFPELERGARVNEFTRETDPDGKMHFRCQQYFGMPAWDMYAAADGQFGTIIRAWREYSLSGDKAFLETVYPGAVRAFDYGLREWDKDGDGVPEAMQHNTYDIEFYGANPLSGVMLLGAAKALGRMAEIMGDEPRGIACAELFDKSQKRLEELCWQGEYYVQRLDDVDEHPYQFGTGCLSDQLLGQTLAYVTGLGDLLPPEHIRSACRAIYNNNFLTGFKRDDCLQRLYVADDETGLTLCSWPMGGKPRFPFVYSDEVWTGIEYQVATLLIEAGMIDEALAMVDAVRARFDGVRRNPWSEMECGHHYARSMASWGLLVALSGMNVSPEGDTSFAPKINADAFRAFYCDGRHWGVYSQSTLANGGVERHIEILG